MQEGHRLLIVPIQFRNWKFPESEAYTRAAAEYAVKYWNSEFAQRDFTYDLIWPPWLIDTDLPSCNMAFLQPTLIAVRAAGHRGKIDFELGPSAPLCGGRSNATYFSVPLTGMATTMTHETGHRLGLAHISNLPGPYGTPFDAEAQYALPFTAQDEYCASSDIMGMGNTPGYPNLPPLTGWSRDHLKPAQPTDLALSWQRGRWTYLAYRTGITYELFIVGPYKGKYGAGPRAYYLGGSWPNGSRWEDATGGLPKATIYFGPSVEVR